MEKNMKRWVLISEERGVFLGTYNPDQPTMSYDDMVIEASAGLPDDQENYQMKLALLFAIDDPFVLENCVAFDTEKKAEIFINKMLADQPDYIKEALACKPYEIESEGKWPHVSDLINAGFEHATYQMDTRMIDRRNGGEKDEDRVVH